MTNERTNDQRANDIYNRVAGYNQQTDMQSLIEDVLTDLMHLAHREGVSWTVAMQLAGMNFEAEVQYGDGPGEPMPRTEFEFIALDECDTDPLELLIGSAGWMLVQLNGERVKVGDNVLDREGRTSVIQGGRPPQHEGSSGKVWTTFGEYYPAVFNLKWVRLGS